MGCPDESDLVAFAEGLLDGARRDAVAQHLDRCEECAMLVGVAGRGPGTRETVLPRGAALGRYIVVGKLGQGGLGIVYVAYDPELDRRIAIKVLKPQTLSDGATVDVADRFAREAKALARVAHPNVVAVYDTGVVDGRAFIAMELVDGVTLGQWLKAEERTWQQIRDVFAAAGEGLLAVHEAELVHRDFKPANVLVGADGRVRVLDFGLARLIGEPVEGRPDTAGRRLADGVTPSGFVLGTPAYISPEQVDGTSVGPAADQFSFAVALHEALFGTRPFAEHDLGKRRQAALEWEPPSAGRPDLPPPLVEAIARGLAADPGRRHPSMQEFVDALRFEVPRRRRLRAVLAGVVVVAVAAAGVAFAVQLQPEPEALDQVEALADEAYAAAAKGFYVYPPADEPAEPTAYNKVIELEMFSGAAAGEATARALTLRGEFSDALVRLGDRYWDDEAGRPFAAEYYVAALIFDPTRERALQRAMVTPTQLARLQTTAKTSDFSAAELEAARSLLALAQPEAERRSAVEALLRSERAPRAMASAQLAALVGLDERAPAVAVAEPPRDPDPVVEPRPEEETVQPEPASAGTRDRRRAGRAERDVSEVKAPPPEAKAPELTEAERDAASARTLAADGRRALAAGRTPEAERLFHRALEADARSVGALDGLREIYFERGNYRQAIGFAKRSVRVAPRDAKLRLHLGDLYFRVLQYSDARAQYEKARELGSSKAADRLARLDDKTGR